MMKQQSGKVTKTVDPRSMYRTSSEGESRTRSSDLRLPEGESTDVLSPLRAKSHNRKASMLVRMDFNKSTSSLSSYQVEPIEKHYKISRQILTSFDSHWNNQLWATAYTVGSTFLDISLLEIPKHGYFHAPRHVTDRQENSRQAKRVATHLHQLLTGQEQTLISAGPDSLRRLELFLKLAREEVVRAERGQPFDETLAQALGRGETRPGSMDLIVDVTPVDGRPLDESVADSVFYTTPSDPDAPLFDDESVRYSEIQLGDSASSLNYNNNLDSSVCSVSFTGSLINVGLKQAPEDVRLTQALFLSGLQVQESTTVTSSLTDPSTLQPLPGLRRNSSTAMTLSIVMPFYHEDFEALRQSHSVSIKYIDTYQSRIPETTNGCAVIAPLLCAKHIVAKISSKDRQNGGDPGLTNEAVIGAIDNEAASLLVALRKRLGLSRDAMLIPSDAQDYLMEKKWLSERNFYSMCGGNILDDGHLQSFGDELKRVQNVKVAASLFFHEHVVAILKLQRTRKQKNGKDTFWYDIWDSLPYKKTLCAPGESEEQLCARIKVPNDTTRMGISKTARIRCASIENLLTALKWYACSKFTESNMAYIDKWQWNEDAVDFDPRVFQATVWTGVSTKRHESGLASF